MACENCANIPGKMTLVDKEDGVFKCVKCGKIVKELSPLDKAAEILDKLAIQAYEEDGSVGISTVLATVAKALRGEE